MGIVGRKIIVKSLKFEGVKKIATILFLFSFLNYNTELHQLFKLKFLVEHYFEHLNNNRNLTLIDFFDIHYSSSQSNYPDKDKDMKLPFKSHKECTVSVDVVPTFINAFILLKPVVFIKKEYPIYNDFAFQNAYLSSIWQPPRVC